MTEFHKAPTRPPLTGDWTLTGFGAIDFDTAADQEAAAAWTEEVPEKFPGLNAVHGLTLSISAEGKVSEKAGAKPSKAIQMFSADGVLEESPAEAVFPGYLHEADGRTFVLADDADPDGHCRIDDGDVAISDELRRKDYDLLRIVSIVVDELYLYRFVYRYAHLT